MRQIIHHFTLLIFIFLCMEVSAQPSLTRSVHQPVIGDIELRYLYSDTNHLPPGPSGLNAVWDFSNVNFNPIPDTVWYEPMISHFGMQGDVVARKKITFQGFPLNHYEVFSTGPGHTAYQGWAILPFGPDFPYADLSDPSLLHNYPMSYSDSLSDFYAGIEWGLTGIPFSGNQVAVIDGKGTLILPTGSYTDVLRLHIYTANGGGNGNLWQGYYYYSATDRFPLLALPDTPFHPLGVAQPIYITTPLNINVAQNEAEPDPTIQLGPNPTSGLTSLTIEGQLNESLEWLVYNPQGKLILRGHEPKLPSQFRKTIDLSEQPSGIYLLEIRVGEIRTIRRVAKL